MLVSVCAQCCSAPPVLPSLVVRRACLRAGLLAVFVAITLALTGTNNPGLSG